MTFLTEEYIQNLVSRKLAEFYIEILDSAEARARKGRRTIVLEPTLTLRVAPRRERA